MHILSVLAQKLATSLFEHLVMGILVDTPFFVGGCFVLSHFFVVDNDVVYFSMS